jgi:hypothetical protein
MYLTCVLVALFVTIEQEQQQQQQVKKKESL